MKKTTTLHQKKERGVAGKYNGMLLFAVVFIGYLVFGLSENIKGPAIPRIQSEYGLNEIQLGLLLSLNSTGYLLACSFTGIMSRRIGLKAATMIALFSMTLAGLFIYLSFSFPLFVFSYFLLYIGNGILEIVFGILSARIFIKNTGTLMSMAHGFYGLSSTFAPLFAVRIMSFHALGSLSGWKGMYFLMLLPCLIPAILGLFLKFPGDEENGEGKLSTKQYLKDPVAWYMVGILTLGVIAELSVGNWLVNYLEKVYSWESGRASGMLSAFFFAFMLARLLLGPVTDRLGYAKSIVLFSGFSGLCTLLGILSGPGGAFFFALSGAGIAPVYPAVMAFLAKYYAKSSDTAVSFTVTFMGIGSVAGNFVIGAVMDMSEALFSLSLPAATAYGAGLKSGYVFIGLCALACAFLSYKLHRRLKQAPSEASTQLQQ